VVATAGFTKIAPHPLSICSRRRTTDRAGCICSDICSQRPHSLLRPQFLRRL